MDLAREMPVKVYTFWKEGEKPEVRRFDIFRGACDSIFSLTNKLLEVYPGLRDKEYTICWKDEEGDDVAVSSDQELMTALRFTHYESLKLYIYVKGQEKKVEPGRVFLGSATIPGLFGTGVTGMTGMTPNGGSYSINMHMGVACDGCDGDVVGFRYKCTVCDDYDLCARCESAGMHPEHCMMRVPTPNMPRDDIKAAIKRSRHFLKTVRNIADECPYNKRRRDKSGERRHRGHHGGHHSSHGGDHRRPRPSWLETFATYMNEFANLAGDIDLSDDKPKAPEPTPSTSEPKPQPQQQPPQEAPKPPEPQATQEKAQPTEAKQPEQPGISVRTARANARCVLLPSGFTDLIGGPNVTIENIQHYIPNSASVDDVKGLIEKLFQNMIPVPSSQPASDVEMGQGDRKSAEADNATATSEASMKSAASNASVKSGASATSIKSVSSVASSMNTDFYKDASPDKVDDWTMVNKDLMDASIPAEQVPPIGFNLPEEFQERVKISVGGSLYPPLNTSTAEAEVRAAAPAPSAPVQQGASAPVPPPAAPAPPKPAPAPQPRPQPRQRHPKPHIDAAIEQMLAMGFTNDGGWLTQLLESKDGNIAAVLDLLTPVNPKK